jgi:hypothetical protein
MIAAVGLFRGPENGGESLGRSRLAPRASRVVRTPSDELCGDIGQTGLQSTGSAAQWDVEILKSLPGIGRIDLATLLSEASEPISRRDYQALRTLSGVAPVTKRSGKSHIVTMRCAAHVRLRGAVYHWARIAIQHDLKSRARYAALRKRGHSHGRAIRGVADRLLALACLLLHRQTPFDPHFGQNRCALIIGLSELRSALARRFFVRLVPFLRPGLQRCGATRAAAVRTGRRPPRRRREAVLTAASMARGFNQVGACSRHRMSIIALGGCGFTAPQFHLDGW